MTSEQNTSQKTMRIILSTPSKPTTKSPPTVPAAYALTSTSTGTTQHLQPTLTSASRVFRPRSNQIWPSDDQKPQHASHPWTAPIYVKKTAQRPTATNTSPLCDNKWKQTVHSIAGTFFYYSEIDPCIKTALNEISSRKSKPTQETMKYSI